MTPTPHISIPEWTIALLNREGYMARFYHHKGESKTNREAWEAVESELEKYFKTNRYNSLASFQNSMKEWQKKKNKS